MPDPTLFLAPSPLPHDTNTPFTFFSQTATSSITKPHIITSFSTTTTTTSPFENNYHQIHAHFPPHTHTNSLHTNFMGGLLGGASNSVTNDITGAKNNALNALGINTEENHQKIMAKEPLPYQVPFGPDPLAMAKGSAKEPNGNFEYLKCECWNCTWNVSVEIVLEMWVLKL